MCDKCLKAAYKIELGIGFGNILPSFISRCERPYELVNNRLWRMTFKFPYKNRVAPVVETESRPIIWYKGM